MGDSIIRSTESNWQDFSNYLSNAFKSQFGDQSALFKQLTSTLTQQLQNPHGFDPATLSALRGSATDNITKQYENARVALGNKFAVNGSSDVKSGVEAQIRGGLAGQQAGDQATALDNIQQQDAQLKDRNYWQALSGLKDVAGMENPTGIGNLANGAAATTGELGSEYFKTDNSGFWDKLGGSFAESLGSGLGSVLSGGVKNKAGL